MQFGKGDMLTYALVAAGPAAIVPFTAMWLHNRGVGFELLGILLAIPFVLRLVICRPLVVWSARFGSPWMPVALLCSLACLLSLVCASSGALAPALIAWWGIGVAAGFCTPLMDAAILTGTPTGQSSKALGGAKGAGALAYLIAVPAIGFCLGRGGTVAILLWSGASALLACIHATRLSASYRARSDRQVETTLPERPPIRDGGNANRGRFLVMLIAVTLIEASHGLQSIVMIHWGERGITPQLNGVLWATGTLADVVFLWATGALRKRIGPAALLVIGGAAAVVRWIGFAIDPPLPVLFALQALHALSFTATCLAAVELTRALAGSAATGRQVVTWATSTGLASGLAVLVAAPLYGAIGTSGYGIMALLAVAGLLVAIYLYRSEEDYGQPMAGCAYTIARSIPIAAD